MTRTTAGVKFSEVFDSDPALEAATTEASVPMEAVRSQLSDEIASVLDELARERDRLGTGEAKPVEIIVAKAYAKDMEIDSRLQRTEQLTLINSIANEFNELALGTLHISLRVDDDGEEHLIVLDGQQRRKGSMLAGYTNQLRCIMYKNLTFSQEAQLFRLLNNRKSVNAPTLFRIAIAEGDVQATAIAAILTQLNIPLAVPGGFAAVVAARRIAARRGGLGHLRWALEIVQRVYGGSPDAPKDTKTIYDSRVVEALSLLHERDGHFLNERNLVSKLAKQPNGIDGLVQRARTIGTLNKGGSRVFDMFDAIVAYYNLGLHRDAGNMLAEWDRGRRTVVASKKKTAKGKHEKVEVEVEA
jgi:hypothetical protein